MQADLFQKTTDTIVRMMLENGSDWKRPWLGDGLAKNIITGHSYRGTNIPVLGSAGFTSHEWGSYKQWQDVGAQVRRNEKSTLIFLWKDWHTKDKETDEGRIIKLVRAFPVFNREQVDNPPPEKKDTRTPIERHAEFERVVAATGANITHGGDRAAYISSQDRITMPKIEQFKSNEGYAGTLSHELGHWSGAKHRLDRDLSGRFGDKAYSLEELVAEISSALTCISVGVIPEPRKETAQYLNSWVDAMKEDKRIIVTVFSKAQAATDFILKTADPTPEAEPTRPEPSQQAKAAEVGL